MKTIFDILKLVAVLVAAISIGNWYLAEWRKAKNSGLPWYSHYLSIPGILIILIVLLPFFLWLSK